MAVYANVKCKVFIHPANPGIETGDVGTTTTINHATNFDAGRYQLQIEYTVL